MTYYAITTHKDRIGNRSYSYRKFEGYESKAHLKRCRKGITNFVAIYTEEQAIEKFETLDKFR